MAKKKAKKTQKEKKPRVSLGSFLVSLIEKTAAAKKLRGLKATETLCGQVAEKFPKAEGFLNHPNEHLSYYKSQWAKQVHNCTLRDYLDKHEPLKKKEKKKKGKK